MLTSILTHIVIGVMFFFVGTRWGYIIIESFKSPVDRKYLLAGQKWHLPGAGTIKLLSVWPECVTYFLTAEGPDHVRVMDRKLFGEHARDENGRDPAGRFHKSIKNRVLKFEVHNGNKNDET